MILPTEFQLRYWLWSSQTSYCKFRAASGTKLHSGKSLNRNMPVFDQFWKVNITEKKKWLPLFLLGMTVHPSCPFLDKAHWILQRKIPILYSSCLNFLLCLLFASADFRPEINLWIRGAFFCLFGECTSQREKNNKL